MKLSVKGMAIAVALFWGVLAMLLTGLANMIWPGYGKAFLDLMASVYPGYHATATLGDVIVGALYGLLDGAVGGAVFAWLYNRFAG
ncbi:MAG: bacteriophage holin [Candidatus Acidiferrales bacterium]